MFNGLSHLEQIYLAHLDEKHFNGYGVDLWKTDHKAFYGGMNKFVNKEIMGEL